MIVIGLVGQLSTCCVHALVEAANTNAVATAAILRLEIENMALPFEGLNTEESGKVVDVRRAPASRLPWHDHGPAVQQCAALETARLLPGVDTFSKDGTCMSSIDATA